MNTQTTTTRSIDAHLTSMRMLRDGWAGQGTIAPSSAVIDAARELAQHLTERRVQLPDPAISDRGDIIFAFERDLARDLVIVRADRGGELSTVRIVPGDTVMQIRRLATTPVSGVYSFLSSRG